MSEPLYGDKALELFFGSNASGVATAMWATAMRNNYEDRVAKLEEQVEFWKNMALGLKDEMVQRGNEIDGLRAQLATAQKWRTRWKAMAHRKRQHHRNALAALGLNITYVRELQQEVKRLDEQVDGLQAQLATAQQELADVSATDATAVFSADIGTAKIPNEGLVDYVRWNVVVEKWDEQLGRIADIAERINTRAARDIEERERRMQQYEQYD